ncbi:hypothetical protein ACA910_009232 [Epithemia clementina (nom. ined.)]
MLSTIAAAVFMVPPALVIVATAPVIALLSLPGLALLCYRRPKKAPGVDETKKNEDNVSTKQRRRAIVTGGSSGMGLAVGEECVKRGFDEVILIARNVERLNKAKDKLKSLLKAKEYETKTTRIEAYSADVSKVEDLQSVADKMFGVEGATANTFTCLFCIAGTTYPEYFSKTPVTEFANIVQTNQLGTIFTVQTFLPHITTGTILFTSSMAGQVGTFGFTSYSPTKFALRGFAEALHMELVSRPISVCVAYPPDTDTPGFEAENLTKPAETKLISEEVGLAKPEDVARTMVDEASKENPNFAIYFNFDGWMLSALTAGFSPVTSLFEAATQVAGMCLFRIISLFYLKQWTLMIRRYSKDKADSTQPEVSGPSQKDTNTTKSSN